MISTIDAPEAADLGPAVVNPTGVRCVHDGRGAPADRVVIFRRTRS